MDDMTSTGGPEMDIESLATSSPLAPASSASYNPAFHCIGPVVLAVWQEDHPSIFVSVSNPSEYPYSDSSISNWTRYVLPLGIWKKYMPSESVAPDATTWFDRTSEHSNSFTVKFPTVPSPRSIRPFWLESSQTVPHTMALGSRFCCCCWSSLGVPVKNMLFADGEGVGVSKVFCTLTVVVDVLAVVGVVGGFVRALVGFIVGWGTDVSVGTGVDTTISPISSGITVTPHVAIP